MIIWLVKFVPYEGGMMHMLCFRSEEAARQAQLLTNENVRTYRDDFGVEVYVDPSRCAIVLTSTHISAAFTSAIQAAEQDAMKTYNLQSVKREPGSTMQ